MTFARGNNASARDVERVLAQIDALLPARPRVTAWAGGGSGDAGRIVELLSADATLLARVLSILDDSCAETPVFASPAVKDGWPMSSGHGGVDDAGAGESVIVSPTSEGGGPPDVPGGPPDLNQLVRLHGADAVRQVALALVVADALACGQSESKSAGDTADHAALFRHGLATAFAAKSIAAALDVSCSSAEAFACGLLHDLGKAALRAALPKSFERIVLICERTGADIADVERELLGIDHTGIGRHLAVRWRLPRRWVECIWLHHQLPDALPASVADVGHVQIVQLADTITREQRLGYSGTQRLEASSGTLAERLGLCEADRLRIIASLPAELERQTLLASARRHVATGEANSASVSTPSQLTTDSSEATLRTARLERKADYLRALHTLNRDLSPHASVREVCSAAAAVVCQALSVSACVVFVTGEDGCCVDEAFSDGRLYGVVEPRLSAAPVELRADDVATELAAAGTGIVPPPASLAPMVDRYRGRLGEDPVWVLPILMERRCAAGILFTQAAAHAARLRTESEELDVLSVAVGVAMTQARARADAVALGDELADVNRRLASMQDELLRGRTLQSVVAMAAGAAHELNNPLAVISGRAQLLRRHPGSEEVRNIADAIAAQANICSDIVTELMDFARSSAPRPEAVDLRSCVDVVVAELASGGLLAVGEVDLAISSDTPPIWFDRMHCERLFAALLTNAIEATDATSRRLTVKATRHLTEDWVAVDVIDNGRGMTADVLSRAMDPFFSRRPAGRGRGLGLARVERWLQQGGGTIRIDSDPNRGTHVRLRFAGVATSSD